MKLADWARRSVNAVKDVARIGHSDEPDVFFTKMDYARLHELHSAASPDVLDEQTWNDLLMDRYFEKISDESSIFGKQILYQRLRTGLDPMARNDSSAQFRSLMGDGERLARIHAAFAGLRATGTEIADLLYANDNVLCLPRWMWVAKFAPLVLSIAVLTAIFAPVQSVAAASLFLGMGLVALLFGVHMSYEDAIRRWDMRIGSVTALLSTVTKLGSLNDTELQWFTDHRPEAARLVRKLNRVQLRAGLAESIQNYLDWFVLGKVRHYFKQVQRIAQAREALREFHLNCANLEANMSIAHHLRHMKRFCWTRQAAAHEISLTDMTHPLLEDLEPMSIQIQQQGILLTGQNGAGKSTLLRMIGINAIAARTFGFCYASRAALPELSIRASMLNQDSLFDGESLYVSELRRARELLEYEGTACRLYLIDEIFRGTNYLESVAAAASLLHRLADRGLVIVSSHHLVLGPVLADKYASMHVMIDEATRKPVLRHGVLEKTNGISLLTAHGFDEQLERNAVKVFDWLSQYLAQPTGKVCILADPELKEARPIPLRSRVG